MKHLLEINSWEINKYTKEFYINKISRLLLNQILLANTPEEIEKIISDNESNIANSINPNKEGYLDCDEACDIMHYFLQIKKIPHQLIIGKSDEGSSHAYVKIGEHRYDPTHQGFGDMSDELIIWSSQNKLQND